VTPQAYSALSEQEPPTSARELQQMKALEKRRALQLEQGKTPAY